MQIQINLPDDIAAELAAEASARGLVPEQVALGAIRQSLADRRRLEESLAPVHTAFKASGMTEEELAEQLEAEKHAMRRGE